MSASFVPTPVELFRFLPETILTVTGTVLMVLEAVTSPARKKFLGPIGLAGLFAALWAAVVSHTNPGPAFQGLLLIDGYSTFFRVLVIAVGILVCLISFQYLRNERSDSGEYYALIVFSTMGQCVMVTANDLIMNLFKPVLAVAGYNDIGNASGLIA